ncbi:glycosyltransferase [Candidatus Halocynthiibacter alkanivorans]|uniref:glycosyltransferase n=1 Tax=Candidatus Halocynthiibacter alkanivorans TaxID=2267619 RepID=UPI000DF2F9B0|nr:glycosyltransferase [Candidatus Halocynthiibacter alkanivorans]
MSRPVVAHLVDDTTPGGVMRVLNHIVTSKEMAQTGQHQLHPVRRGALPFRRIKADVIVSHLAVSWRTLPSLIALRALHADLRLIHVEHSYTECSTALNVKHKHRFMTLLRTAYSLFDRVVAVSHDQARWFGARSLVARANLVVIPSTVDLDQFRVLATPGPEIRVVGAMGRLHRQKGFDTLIRAFVACEPRDMELHIHGDGPERAALETLAEGDPRIRFFGHSDDPVAVMATLDAVAVPSRWEAYGLVALEARAAGRLVLAANVDGLKDQISEGASGVACASVAAWSHALNGLAYLTVPQSARGVQNTRMAQREQQFAAQWETVISGQDVRHVMPRRVTRTPVQR